MSSNPRTPIVFILLVSLMASSVQMPAFAQMASFSSTDSLSKEQRILPPPGVMVPLSPAYTPAYLKGIMIDPKEPLKFDFIVYKGDHFVRHPERSEGSLTEQQLKKKEYTKLVKYFLASLAIPDEDQWVNLSPYENDRIIKDDFGKTAMGRDLLEADYWLKEITSSLMYPEGHLGKSFWNKVYARAWEQFHTTHIPVNTFNKVWIVPDEAVIYEKSDENKSGSTKQGTGTITAYIIKSHLKVMLEEDYLAMQKQLPLAPSLKKEGARGSSINSLGSQIMRAIILPVLEKEVNEGQNFAQLRQIVSGMVLATWYKNALRSSLLGRIYVDKAKVKGIDQDPQFNKAIYHAYLQAFKEGVYNYIKEDLDIISRQRIPRKYFSGGFVRNAAMTVIKADSPMSVDEVQEAAEALQDAATTALEKVGVSLLLPKKGTAVPNTQVQDAAMTVKEYLEYLDGHPGASLIPVKVTLKKEFTPQTFVQKTFLVPNAKGHFLPKGVITNYARGYYSPETVFEVFGTNTELTLKNTDIESIDRYQEMDAQVKTMVELQKWISKKVGKGTYVYMSDVPISIIFEHQPAFAAFSRILTTRGEGYLANDLRVKGFSLTPLDPQNSTMYLQDTDNINEEIPVKGHEILGFILPKSDPAMIDEMGKVPTAAEQRQLQELVEGQMGVLSASFRKLSPVAARGTLSPEVVETILFGKREISYDLYRRLHAGREPMLHPDRFLFPEFLNNALDRNFKIYFVPSGASGGFEIHTADGPVKTFAVYVDKDHDRIYFPLGFLLNGVSQGRTGLTRSFNAPTDNQWNHFRGLLSTALKTIAEKYYNLVVLDKTDGSFYVLPALSVGQPSVNNGASWVPTSQLPATVLSSLENVHIQLDNGRTITFVDIIEHYFKGVLLTQGIHLYNEAGRKQSPTDPPLAYIALTEQQVLKLRKRGLDLKDGVPVVIAGRFNPWADARAIVEASISSFATHYDYLLDPEVRSENLVKSWLNLFLRFNPKDPMRGSIQFVDSGIMTDRDAKIINRLMGKALQEAFPRNTPLASRAMMSESPGGIDLNSRNLNLLIRRNGHGIVLPASQQDMAQLSRIQGFVPEIVEITPITHLSILSELKEKLQGHL